ncbi:MAG: PAS domain S-box protein [Bacteroidales bacterium]|nr:PAS domain S-box protein [Bacteroidales bacterium]
MMKTIKKHILLFLIISLHFGLIAQTSDYNFTKIDSLYEQHRTKEVLIELNLYENLASQSNDTLTLFKVYDCYINVFENDTVTDNEKKFILKKIFLIKSYLNSRPDDKNVLKDLIFEYNKLAFFYSKRREFYTAIDIYYRIILIAESIDEADEVARIYSKIGTMFQRSKSYPEALENYKIAISYGRKLSDSLIVIDNLILTGNLFSEVGDYSNAVYKYYEAVSIAEFVDDLKRKSDAYTQLAKIFYTLELYEKAIEYSNKSMRLYSLGDTVFSDDLIMERYIFLGKNFLEIDSIDLAINNFNNALYIAQKIESERNIALIYSLLGIAHTQSEDYTLAEDFLTKSLLIRNKIGDSLDICQSKLAFGKFYLKTQNYSQAKFYLINAYKTAEKIENFLLVKEISLLLANIFEDEQNFELALKYQQRYVTANDSLFKKNNFVSIEKLEAEHEYRLNNNFIRQEVDLLNKSKHQLSFLLIILVIFLLILVVLVVFFIFKIKEASRSKNLIEKQKQIILKQYERYKLLSLVASNTDNSIFIFNSDWIIEWVNDSLLKLYDTTHYDIFSLNNADFTKLTKGDLELIKKICLQQQLPYSYTSLVTINEKKKWIQTTISPIIEDDLVQKLIGIETDITSLKIAQLEIQKQKKDIEYKNKLMDVYNQELKEQKEAIVAQNEELRQQQEELQAHADLLEEYNKELQRLSFVASETDNIVYIFDLSGNLVWVNKAFVKHTGYSLDEYIQEFGKNIIEASTIQSIDYYFYMCVEQKKSVKYISELKTKYGKVLWVQTTLSPLKDKNGAVVEVVGIDADITEVKNAERKITEQNLEIKSSLEYAGRIQRSVLPMPIFVKAIFDKHFIFNRPRDIVSGDFYFAHYIKNKAILALADSTGHGIPGAFMSLLGSMALKIVVSNLLNYDPNIVLKKLNNEIIRLLHQRGHKKGSIDSIDMAFCVFDFEKNTLDYAGANIPLFLARKNAAEYLINRIKPSKATIGYDNISKSFTVNSFKLEKNDRIYMATDGLADQFGGYNNKKLKRKGITELLETLNTLPIEQQEGELDVFLTQWMGNNEQVDDIMVIGIEY